MCLCAVIALQKPVRPATGGEPAGSPLFLLYRKVPPLGLLDIKSARKLAGTTNKR